MQLLLHRTRLKTAERESDFSDENADAALKGSIEHRRSAKNVRFLACQDFVSGGTCLSDQTRQRQFSRKMDAPLALVQRRQYASVPVTTRTSGCSVTAHSHDPVPAALSQSLKVPHPFGASVRAAPSKLR